jgi:hypothetical protein
VHRILHRLGLDLHPRPDALKAAADDPLARREPLFDNSLPLVQRPDLDGPVDHLVLVVDDIEELLPLVGPQRLFFDEDGLVGGADRQPHAHEQPGGEEPERPLRRLGVLNDASDAQRPGAGVHAVVAEVDEAPMGVSLLVRQAHQHRHLRLRA